MPPHKVSPDEACAVRHMSCRPREVPAQIHFAEVASSRPVRLQSVVWPAPLLDLPDPRHQPVHHPALIRAIAG